MRVSRTLKKLLSRATTRFDHLKPQKRYEKLCREKMICKILIDIRVRSIGRGMMREYGFENLDLFAAADPENEE